ncbi:helix-turn-helix transcriptional regulator [Microbacterium sp. O]|nr:helix-turn-helix transcriptional regulator [Microbacterium sp. O]
MDEKFAAAFKLARQASGLSQADVAKRMADFGFEMSQPVIGKIERGDRKVSIGEGEALSSILGVSTRTLLEGPTTWRLERGTAFVLERAAILMEDIERFESAQQALAQSLGDAYLAHASHPLSRFARSEAERVLGITPADLLDQHEKDAQTRMAAHRFRDSLTDAESDEEIPEQDRLHPDSPLSRLLDERGDKMVSTMDAKGFFEAYEAMRVNERLEGERDVTAPDSAE